MRRYLLILSALVLPFLLAGQTASVRNAVQVWAEAQTTPARITVKWVPMSGATGYTVYRMAKGGTNWGSSIATVSGSVNEYQDNGVSTGIAYEYRVDRAGSNVGGTGYILAGINVPAIEHRGTMVLVVDDSFTASLATEISELVVDLRADGWVVVRHNVSRNATPASIRSLIQGTYNADPDNVKAVFLLGRIPVPYSGNLNPDGHPDHQGAWPADGYYGEMNGNWTDNSVNNTSSQNNRNHNVPGDGKFDQSDYPSPLELQVGRVDFFEFESFQYYQGLNETQLLRNYLIKAHEFKTKQFTPQFRGCVFDNFDDMPYALAGSGYRSISALVGPSALTDLNPNASPFTTHINGQSYLWTYASGGGGWSLASNVGGTWDFAQNVSMGGVFNMMFGSYFGDWNVQNNFLRAPLGSGRALTNVWAGIPNWFFHHMGMGENIGYSVQRSMNNTTLYTPQNPGWQGSPFSRVHMALHGDPSLRQLMVPKPASLQITNSNGVAAFSWSQPANGVDGYHIYTVDPNSGEALRLNSNVLTGGSYIDPTVPFVAGREYMVRAVKLETVPTGTFQNLSLGTFGVASSSGQPDCLGVVNGPAVVGSTCNDNNPCTTNDVWNASCQCVGTFQDTDGDGICNAQDNCPNTPGQIGSSCNDNNPCTINDVIGANCQCAGTFQDTDGDGICNAQDNCPNTPGQIGSACNDNNACTINDVIGANCQCAGTFQDTDGDGICNAQDNCPNTPGQVGSSCNDNNACTTNDVLNANCQCVGTPGPDSDGDGVCDAQDNCPNTPGQIGSACNDNNACTINDVIGANCQCAGTFQDSDGDGICNAQDNCPNTPGQIGSACNDNDPCTINDVIGANCQCAGTFQDSDGDGICNAKDNCPNTPGQIGSACNDNNPCTINDVVGANCQCAGTFQDSDGDGICNAQDNCPNTPGQVGSACNDNNACTINDVLNANCQCVGTPVNDDDGDGICNAQDNCPNTPGQIGSACNDNDPCTTNDTVNANCQCVGTPVPDSDGDGICNALDNCPNTPGQIGSACNDNNPCTINDVIGANCQCAGTFQDSDGDGICNAQDNCPNTPGQIGSACNDNNPCTINDVIGANCQCAGTFQDTDGDGICNAQDNCPNTPGQVGSACNDGDPNTINDALNANCQCVGTAVGLDCLGVPNGAAQPGTACNDNNPNTGNDVWTTNCQCQGQLIDCLGVPGGTQVPGTPCNDGDPCTTNDQLKSDCQCRGVPVPDSDGDGLCDAVDDCPSIPGEIGSSCNDGDPDTGNDVIGADCTCAGQLIDCNGMAGGNALPGTPCNGDGDLWSVDCECIGNSLPMDCAGVPGGEAYIDQCGVCAGGSTGVEPNADTDGDGLLDCLDVCPTLYDPGQADFDGDGVGDACDNCVWVHNTDQADVNQNGIGDACELINGMFEQGGGASVLEVYPNPAVDDLFIRSHHPDARTLRIHDLAGKVLQEIRFATKVDLRQLAAGTYVLIALDADGNARGRIRFVRQ